MTTKLSAFRHGIAAILIGACVVAHLAAQHSPVRVLVWDEQQPEQAQAYDNFLGNEIAAYLKKQPGLEVHSVRLDDANQGITAQSLDQTDVLVWWGHRRHGELAAEISRNIVERIQAGKLSLIALHAAHWSSPFMEAMAERTRADARRRYPDPETKFEFVAVPGRMPPTYDSLVTPAYYALITPSGAGGGVGRCESICPTASSLEFGPMGNPAR